MINPDTYKLHKRYLKGESVAVLAEEAGISRQRLYRKFITSGLTLKKPNNPVIEYRGRKYTKVAGYSYYRNTVAPHDLLHRTMWEDAHGALDGRELRFLNGDTTDVRLDNLVAFGGEPAPKHNKPWSKGEVEQVIISTINNQFFPAPAERAAAILTDAGITEKDFNTSFLKYVAEPILNSVRTAVRDIERNNICQKE